MIWQYLQVFHPARCWDSPHWERLKPKPERSWGEPDRVVEGLPEHTYLHLDHAVLEWSQIDGFLRSMYQMWGSPLSHWGNFHKGKLGPASPPVSPGQIVEDIYLSLQWRSEVGVTLCKIEEWLSHGHPKSDGRVQDGLPRRRKYWSYCGDQMGHFCILEYKILTSWMTPDEEYEGYWACPQCVSCRLLGY